MSIYNLCLQQWMGRKKETPSLPLFPHLFFPVMEEIENFMSSKTLPPDRHLPIYNMELNVQNIIQRHL